MIVIRHEADITGVQDPALRQLIHSSAEQLLGQFEPGEFSLEDLCFYIVVETEDTAAEAITAINEQIGRSLLDVKPELVLDHPGWHQLVMVLDDSGFGVEIFIPKEGYLLALMAGLTPTIKGSDA